RGPPPTSRRLTRASLSSVPLGLDGPLGRAGARCQTYGGLSKFHACVLRRCGPRAGPQESSRRPQPREPLGPRGPACPTSTIPRPPGQTPTSTRSHPSISREVRLSPFLPGTGAVLQAGGGGGKRCGSGQVVTPLFHQYWRGLGRGGGGDSELAPCTLHLQRSVGGRSSEQAPSSRLINRVVQIPCGPAPDPNQPAKIETDYWPCPPSLAVVETEWRKRKASRRGAEEEEEEEDDDSGDEMKALRERQKEELSKVTSNLGKMILKEEMEKSLPIRRKTRSLPDRTPLHASLHPGTSKSSSLPAYGRTTLSRLQSTDFSPSESDSGSPGERRSWGLWCGRGLWPGQVWRPLSDWPFSPAGLQVSASPRGRRRSAGSRRQAVSVGAGQGDEGPPRSPG
uniref:Dematin actin binding protein n=1 Tax=Oryctolagus cuniculus TaxID=9986 RepID=A0A5F9CPH9_RABIT